MENNQRPDFAKRVKTYDALSKIIVRILFAISSITAFFIILAFLINAKTGFDVAKFGSLQALLAAVNVYVLKHYFGKKDVS